MTTIAIQRTRNGVLSSADQALVSLKNSAGVTILAPTFVAPSGPGLYSYTNSTLLPGSYTATWTFSTVGQADDVVSRVFTLDPPQAISAGVTLMAIEQRVARRTGPYRRVKATAGSTLTRLASARLMSSLALGSYEDQFLLRRGITWTNQLVANFNPNDRVRNVSLYDPTNGWLLNDQDWAMAPDVSNAEAVEIMYLEPEEELRPSVLDGLTRCFFWDTVSVSLTSALAANILNLTALIPWLTNPRWVREVSFSTPNSRFAPTRVSWWYAYQQGSAVWLRTEGVYLGSLLLDILRPVSSYVNELTSLTGPNDDLDVLYVDPDYAAWAGMLELWKNVPERLQPLVAQQLRPSREDAALEFTKKSAQIASAMPDSFTIRWGNTDLTSVQIGNLMEPV